MELNAAYAVSGISVGLTFLGMPAEAMALGGFAGAIVIGLSDPLKKQKAILNVLASMIFAGACSPLGEVIFTRYVSNYSPQEILAMRVFLPVVIGAGWPWLLPKIALLAESWIKAFHKKDNSDRSDK